MPRRKDEFTPDPFANEFLEKDPTETDLQYPTEEIDLVDDFYDQHDHQICPAMDPRAAEWQEHSFEHNNDFQAPFWVADNIFELARFRVPPSMQGRVSVLETAALGVLATSAVQPNTAYLYPQAYLDVCNTDFPEALEKALAFYLRLESWKRDDLPGAARAYANRNSLPGVPYPPLGEWHDTRYDFSRQSKPSLLVPEAHYLTLWCEIVVRQIPRLMALWGRLGGITQSYHDNPQAIDAARGWPQL